MMADVLPIVVVSIVVLMVLAAIGWVVFDALMAKDDE